MAQLYIIPLTAQSQKPSLPDPVKFLNKKDIVWNVVRSVLEEEMEFNIEFQDRPGGRLVTKPDEFITGSLTSSELDKVAIKNDTITSSWLRARYSVEALLEIVSPTETMVTIRTDIEALNRELDGTEKWITLQSLGVFERRVLGKISMRLLGSEVLFERKKGFWDKTPQPVDPTRKRPIPTRPPV
jgi:hypothetical protein